VAGTRGQGVDRALNAVVGLALCLAGSFTAASLVISFVFAPVEIARGDHLAAVGLSLAPCPGCGMCGMSRAFASFSHGDFSRALEFNPGVVVVWPLFLVMTLACVWGLLQLVRHPLRTESPRHAHS